jgi:glycosyltransferase involved in cell wall biosynthesis
MSEYKQSVEREWRKMSGKKPRVSIAMPVYNGDNYLEYALKTALAQTYADFEIVISDNASTDRTEEICRRLVESDSRVHYYRSEVNRGVYWNFRRGLELSQGEYFMWLAHDDGLTPEFLERCVAALDAEPESVLAYTKAIDIDQNGNQLELKEQVLNAESSNARERFRQMSRLEHNCESIFGLMRVSALRNVRVFPDLADSDRVMLAELCLYGRYARIPEFLFLHREHPQRATSAYPQSRFERTAILLPEKAGKIVFPHFRQFGEYVRCIHRSPLPWRDRMLCYKDMLAWFWRYRGRLRRDIQDVAIYLLRRIFPSTASRTRAATGGHSA